MGGRERNLSAKQAKSAMESYMIAQEAGIAGIRARSHSSRWKFATRLNAKSAYRSQIDDWNDWLPVY
jgi:hypothetical protein